MGRLSKAVEKRKETKKKKDYLARCLELSLSLNQLSHHFHNLVIAGMKNIKYWSVLQRTRAYALQFWYRISSKAKWNKVRRKFTVIRINIITCCFIKTLEGSIKCRWSRLMQILGSRNYLLLCLFFTFINIYISTYIYVLIYLSTLHC